jgi:hypothetical protein
MALSPKQLRFVEEYTSTTTPRAPRARRGTRLPRPT